MLRLELDRLKHRDVRQRRIAIRRLFEIGDPAALAGFIPLLDDEDVWFQEKAAQALRRWVSDGNRKVVLSLANDAMIERRMLAAQLCTRLGQPGLDIIEMLCRDSKSAVKREAWRTRLKMDAGAIPVAIEDEDHIIRRMAVEASGDVELLKRMREDVHSRVAAKARARLKALGSEFEDDPAELLLEPSPSNRKTLSSVLREVDWVEDEALLRDIRASEDRFLLPLLLRPKRGEAYDALRLELLGSDDAMVVCRVLEFLHGREVSEAVNTRVVDLQSSADPLIASTSTSLLADMEARA